ncbi:hypothetical protein ANO11243_018250 [Dothideomycetidae sp. 11243]|nr:hypothetical protein ANO11243_018250 [fungal sp. No.11243]
MEKIRLTGCLVCPVSVQRTYCVFGPGTHFVCSFQLCFVVRLCCPHRLAHTGLEVLTGEALQKKVSLSNRAPACAIIIVGNDSGLDFGPGRRILRLSNAPSLFIDSWEDCLSQVYVRGVRLVMLGLAIFMELVVAGRSCLVQAAHQTCGPHAAAVELRYRGPAGLWGAVVDKSAVGPGNEEDTVDPVRVAPSKVLRDLGYAHVFRQAAHPYGELRQSRLPGRPSRLWKRLDRVAQDVIRSVAGVGETPQVVPRRCRRLEDRTTRCRRVKQRMRKWKTRSRRGPCDWRMQRLGRRKPAVTDLGAVVGVAPVHPIGLECRIGLLGPSRLVCMLIDSVVGRSCHLPGRQSSSLPLFW